MKIITTKDTTCQTEIQRQVLKVETVNWAGLILAHEGAVSPTDIRTFAQNVLTLYKEVSCHKLIPPGTPAFLSVKNDDFVTHCVLCYARTVTHNGNCGLEGPKTTKLDEVTCEDCK